MPTRFPAMLTLAALLGCAHRRTSGQEALLKRADCAELLRAADAARAVEDPAARDLAQGCSQDKLMELVAKSPPAEALLWCGRAHAAAGVTPACPPAKIAELSGQLHPRLSVGPPDASAEPDTLLISALQQLSQETNLYYDQQSPEVMLGSLVIAIDHATSLTIASAPDEHGQVQRVPATQHRFVASASAQVDLSGMTRVLRASEEVRDTTWDAAPKLAVRAKFAPVVPTNEELRSRAAMAWVRSLAKALAAAPPEAVDTTDVRGCVAYGLSVNLAAGDSSAAASGAGDPSRVRTCEQLLGEPAGAGIPVP
jgi:hypothetical protein